MTDEAKITEVSEQMAARTRDLLEYVQGEFGEAFTVGAVAVVIEIDSGDHNNIYHSCSDPRQWVQVGLFREAMHNVEVGETETS